ncbi:MAG TPA: hypothetical protein VG318_08245 [Actinomycetota bacterium]|nr:hypothetical protein [Actinomycetota bacterium]
MPIVHVRGTQSRASRATRATLGRIATATATAVDCPVHEVWCTFEGLAATSIGERVPEEDEAILYVDLLLAPRPDDVMARALEATARAAAESFHTKVENVWARLVRIEPGTVFAGGAAL